VGEKRQTEVRLKCGADAADRIVSVQEVATCQYRLVFASAKLCALAQFKLREVRAIPALPRPGPLRPGLLRLSHGALLTGIRRSPARLSVTTEMTPRPRPRQRQKRSSWTPPRAQRHRPPRVSRHRSPRVLVPQQPRSPLPRAPALSSRPRRPRM
jgi:hypothetical protein